MSELPPPRIESARRNRLSAAWLAPLLALLLGGWLTYRHYAEQGPLITIAFPRAAGLEAGVTVIKHKEVAIGKVTEIDLTEDLKQVLVHARLRKDLAPWLGPRARFWVVRPRVGISGVSGLNTLLSGAYIEADFPARRGTGAPLLAFTGLSEPPLTPGDAPGLRLRLRAEEGGAIQVGAPVFYRRIPVGRVESRRFADRDAGVIFDIFIHAPHHQKVSDQTRFWNLSGIQASLDSEGVEIQTGSLESLLIGGVAFGNPGLARDGQPVAENTVFTLFSTQRAAEEQLFAENITERHHYVLNFHESVRGLKAGAPVEYLGVEVGRVVSFRVQYEAGQPRVPVIVALEPERIGLGGEAQRRIADAVRQGLRGQLQTGSLLTGQRYVVLKFVDSDDAPPVLAASGEYPEIPSIPSDLNQLTDQAYAVLNKLNDLPLAELLLAARQVLDNANGVLAQAETQQVPGELKQTLRATTDALAELRQVGAALRVTMAQTEGVLEGVSPQSSLHYELTTTLQALRQAATAVFRLTDSLERNPAGVLFGQ